MIISVDICVFTDISKYIIIIIIITIIQGYTISPLVTAAVLTLVMEGALW